jgi:hypothetical protein
MFIRAGLRWGWQGRDGVRAARSRPQYEMIKREDDRGARPGSFV